MKDVVFQGITCFTVQLEVARCDKSENLGVLVLESDHNPGYYSLHNFPPNKKSTSDKHCYLLVKKSINCFQDIIHRYTRDNSAKFKHRLHVTPGQMSFHNTDYQCVRINTNEAEFTQDLITDLKSLGIEFIADSKVNSYKSLIYYKKYIEFIQISDGIYQDANLPARYFFTIPQRVDYDIFETKMKEIKNKCGFNLFDSFEAHFFLKDEILDFAGIYSEHCDENRFRELKEQLIDKFGIKN